MTKAMSYNHRDKHLDRACGYTREQAEAIIDAVNNVAQTASGWSEIVQLFEETFTRKELAYALVMSQKNRVDIDQKRPPKFPPEGATLKEVIPIEMDMDEDLEKVIDKIRKALRDARDRM